MQPGLMGGDTQVAARLYLTYLRTERSVLCDATLASRRAFEALRKRSRSFAEAQPRATAKRVCVLIPTCLPGLGSKAEWVRAQCPGLDRSSTPCCCVMLGN